MRTMILSIRPEWVRLILEGRKTIELRKVLPAAESIGKQYPFRVLIYCCQRRKLLSKEDIPLNGKIVAEFECDKIIRVLNWAERKVDEKALEAACGNKIMLMEYAQKKDVYGFHISKLQVYQRPRALEEYGVKRPPQSYCYVEDYA